ncbi:hypothetical protein BDV97DRAFT_412062 [Delphinella strobiligena]|nr:hypothetical protein BDV97DRAFT_412062 [Delphinella strobiligena]
MSDLCLLPIYTLTHDEVLSHHCTHSCIRVFIPTLTRTNKRTSAITYCISDMSHQTICPRDDMMDECETLDCFGEVETFTTKKSGSADPEAWNADLDSYEPELQQRERVVWLQSLLAWERELDDWEADIQARQAVQGDSDTQNTPLDDGAAEDSAEYDFCSDTDSTFTNSNGDAEVESTPYVSTKQTVWRVRCTETMSCTPTSDASEPNLVSDSASGSTPKSASSTGPGSRRRVRFAECPCVKDGSHCRA